LAWNESRDSTAGAKGGAEVRIPEERMRKDSQLTMEEGKYVRLGISPGPCTLDTYFFKEA